MQCRCKDAFLYDIYKERDVYRYLYKYIYM